MIVTQVWLTSEAPQAPAFATGLYIAFINLGVAVGSLVGGWFIAAWGLQGSLLCGAMFAALAAIAIAARLWLQRQATLALRQSSPSPAETSRFPHRPVR